MSKKAASKRHRSKARRPAGDRVQTRESRRAEAVTVAWVISTLATAAALALSLGGWWLQPTTAPTADQPRNMLFLFAPLMLFLAAITGLVTVCITPLVLTLRRQRPPLVITLFAVAVAIAPYGALVWIASR